MHHSANEVRLRAALYLDAVIPALAMLTLADPTSREMVGEMSGRLSICVNQLGTRELSFFKGLVSASPTSSEKEMRGPRARLFFPSASAFLRTMQGGPALALPLCGWRGWKLIQLWERLMRRMEVCSKLSETVDDASLALAVQLQLAVATAALPVLAEQDAECHEAMHHLPVGLALFAAGAQSIPCWVQTGWKPTCGIGQPPVAPLVRVLFENPRIAAAALADKTDQLVELHTTRIRIEGLLPFAEGLDAMMARLRLYLPTA